MWRGGRETVRDRGCCSIDSVDDARRVATMLDLPHYVWNLEEDFEADVVRDFENGYAQGTTPNPCVQCNQRIKFGVLLERARAARSEPSCDRSLRPHRAPQHTGDAPPRP